MFARLRSWYLDSLTKWASSSRVVPSCATFKYGFVYWDTSVRRGRGRERGVPLPFKIESGGLEGMSSSVEVEKLGCEG